jgi:hypothetical protein
MLLCFKEEIVSNVRKMVPKDAERLRNKQHFASMSNEKRNEPNMKKRERRLGKKLQHGGMTSFPGNFVLIR